MRLIVVYDEGHNLSDLQTTRLLELAPDALISASATISVPQALERVIERLRSDRQWTEGDFTTAVSSPDVVASGLVKQRISLGGYVTPMQTAVDALLADMSDAAEAAAAADEPFRPKAIYVCTTNAVDGVPISEDSRRPFSERQARPILIWRHLVAVGVDPSRIAVYCQLQFTKENPPPQSFNLFGGGDRELWSGCVLRSQGTIAVDADKTSRAWQIVAGKSLRKFRSYNESGCGRVEMWRGGFRFEHICSRLFRS